MAVKDKRKHFSEQYPAINVALTNPRQKCEEGKHLDEKTAMLIKLAGNTVGP